MLRTVLACLLAMTAAARAECPPVPDRSEEMAALRTELLRAPSEMAAHPIHRRMWEIWTTAPDEEAQALLNAGARAAGSYDLLGAIAAFDKLVDYCPHYAEGYNQRAFMNFLGGRFEAAIPDLERALALDPGHIGARSGLGLTLLQLGRIEEGQAALREAVAMNPWLAERHLLEEPEGEEL